MGNKAESKEKSRAWINYNEAPVGTDLRFSFKKAEEAKLKAELRKSLESLPPDLAQAFKDWVDDFDEAVDFYTKGFDKQAAGIFDGLVDGVVDGAKRLIDKWRKGVEYAWKYVKKGIEKGKKVVQQVTTEAMKKIETLPAYKEFAKWIKERVHDLIGFKSNFDRNTEAQNLIMGFLDALIDSPSKAMAACSSFFWWWAMVNKIVNVYVELEKGNFMSKLRKDFPELPKKGPNVPKKLRYQAWKKAYNFIMKLLG